VAMKASPSRHSTLASEREVAPRRSVEA
jgi:hypothetical protein